MKILVAYYASALSLGGTVERKGRAMLAALAASFVGHDATYPISVPRMAEGRAVLITEEQAGAYLM